MPWWSWLLVAAVLLLVLILCSRVTIHMYYSRVKENDQFYIGLHVLFGLIRYRFQIPVMKFQGLKEGLQIKTEHVNSHSDEKLAESENTITSEKIIRYFRKLKQVLEATLGLRDWLKDTMKHVQCTELKWTTKVGISDAAETAILTGVVWSLKSSLLGFLFRHVKLVAKPQVMVTPIYNQAMFTTEISCITRIRLGHAILAGLYLLVRMMKGKGGIKAWQNILSKA